MMKVIAMLAGTVMMIAVCVVGFAGCGQRTPEIVNQISSAFEESTEVFEEFKDTVTNIASTEDVEVESFEVDDEVRPSDAKIYSDGAIDWTPENEVRIDAYKDAKNSEADALEDELGEGWADSQRAQAELAELIEKYDKGEITLEEMQAQYKVLHERMYAYLQEDN